MARKNIPKNIIVHHSVTPRDLGVEKTEHSISNNHKTRFNFLSSLGSYIGYHYIIYGDGTVKQYRKEDEEAAHCKEDSMNLLSVGICMIGDFGQGDGRLNETPSDEQLQKLQQLILDLQKKYNIPDSNIYPHRHFAPYKDCYGNNLPDNPLALFTKTSSEELAWLKTNGIIYGDHSPADPVTWGELARVTYRLTKKILEWATSKH